VTEAGPPLSNPAAARLSPDSTSVRIQAVRVAPAGKRGAA
jgi:hypothetical protein